MQDFGYIEVTFLKKDISIFKNIIQNICKKEDFYYSDNINYISGDVTSKLHLTLFYGLVDKDVNKKNLNAHIKKIKLESLKLDSIRIRPGYKDLYQSLCVEVLDKNRKIEYISRSFKKFPYEKSVQIDFVPHLTLAYVKPEFKLRKVPDFLKTIKIKRIRYCKS